MKEEREGKGKERSEGGKELYAGREGQRKIRKGKT